MSKPEIKYWLVHNPDNRLPTAVHPSKPHAISEARRLAKLHIGSKFFVLEAVDCYSVVQPEPTKLYVI